MKEIQNLYDIIQLTGNLCFGSCTLQGSTVDPEVKTQTRLNNVF